jgi:hypothetical protein
MWRAGAMAVGLAVVACGPPPVFTCQTDTSCGEQGQCEPIGYCSFPDADCASGRRYGALASAELANACVGEQEGTGEGSTMAMATTQASSAEDGSTMMPATTSGVATMSGSSSSSSTSTSDASSEAESSASSGGTLHDGLILYMPLDDDFATEDGAFDASGNDLHAQCELCPASVPGRVGQAAGFEMDAVLVVNDDPLLRPADAFTLSLWALDADPDSALTQFLAGKVLTGTTNTFQVSTRAAAVVGEPDEVVWRLTADLSTSFVVAGDNPFEPDAWHHFVGVWDGAVTRTYLDGTQVGEAEATLVGYDVGPFLVGADNNDGGFLYWYRGAIDEVRFYDRALTDDEIGQLASQ